MPSSVQEKLSRGDARCPEPRLHYEPNEFLLEFPFAEDYLRGLNLDQSNEGDMKVSAETSVETPEMSARTSVEMTETSVKTSHAFLKYDGWLRASPSRFPTAGLLGYRSE